MIRKNAYNKKHEGTIDSIMEKLKQNRMTSFIVITLIYIIASAVGVLTYRMVNLSWWLSLLIADIAVTVTTFIFSVFFGNASVYDPYWSV